MKPSEFYLVETVRDGIIHKAKFNDVDLAIAKFLQESNNKNVIEVSIRIVANEKNGS